MDLQQEIHGLTNPVAPSGQAIVGTVEDLQAQTRIKAYRARQAVSTTFDLLGQDLLTATLWLDIRKAQRSGQEFGAAPTAAWTAFRRAGPNAAHDGGSSVAITADGGHRVPSKHAGGQLLHRRSDASFGGESLRARRARGMLQFPAALDTALRDVLRPVAIDPGVGAKFVPADPSSRSGETVVLTGHELNPDQLVAIARYGAKAALSPEAKQRQSDAYGLLLEASAEDAIYGFNRGAGAGREVVLFKGDPLAPENKAFLSQRVARQIHNGPRQGIGPEVARRNRARADGGPRKHDDL